jgi:hypothetical protein
MSNRGGVMEKRTTIYLDEDDIEAISVIQAEYKTRGVEKLTASAAIRLALREMSQRLRQAARRRSNEGQR